VSSLHIAAAHGYLELTMDRTINAKELRASLPRIVERVRRGERFTVLYRSRPSLRIVPVTDEALGDLPLEEDPLYRAKAVGASSDGLTAGDHDRILYGR
jgi:antitoxin (DNA-binding transcriptional repressor) of toxin-antitoxin stability system